MLIPLLFPPPRHLPADREALARAPSRQHPQPLRPALDPHPVRDPHRRASVHDDPSQVAREVRRPSTPAASPAATLSLTCLPSRPSRGEIDLEASFEPCLLNTAIYLLGLSQQVSTFAINFQGRPFRESISENPPLYWGLLGVVAVAYNGSTDFYPEANRWLQLVDMTHSFKFTLTMVMLADFAGCAVRLPLPPAPSPCSDARRLTPFVRSPADRRARLQAPVCRPRAQGARHARLGAAHQAARGRGPRARGQEGPVERARRPKRTAGAAAVLQKQKVGPCPLEKGRVRERARWREREGLDGPLTRARPAAPLYQPPPPAPP